MKVIRCIDSDKAEDKKTSFGGLGGWFDDGMRWKDYLESWTDKVREYAEATREYIVANGIRTTGSEHQDEGWEFLYDDGTVSSFSFRAWGDLMAAIWSEEENEDYNYMDFYC